MIEITKKENCSGCYACSNICPQQCITMESDTEGLWYPVVDYEKCVECDLCIKICPIINRVIVDNNPIAYACMNNDEEIRLKSSSGGMFTLIAENVIEKDGIVFGASFNDEFNLEHIFVETKKQLWKLRGSKYVQSKIGVTYKQAKEFLMSGREVLFTGTPCQIAGLKSYLGKSYINLITIDIICHGVPSPEVWSKYVEFRELKAGSPTQKIVFRRKDEGWKRYSVAFTFMNNTEYRQNLRDDLYMRAFLKNISLRPSCYDCRFKGINRQSDITLADFWGVQNILPEIDDDKGTSLIFLNSGTGQVMFDQIKDKMVCQKVDMQEAIKYNLSAVNSVPHNPKRDKFMDKKDSMAFDKLVNKYCTDPLTLRMKRNVKYGIKKYLKKARLYDVLRGLVGKRK